MRIQNYLLLVVCFLFSCSKNNTAPIRIAINPWPGYEFLYLAERKGFYQEEGIDVSIVQVDSLADGQRAYVNGFVDGLASTVIEAVQSQVLASEPLKIVMVADYSNGGDVIISDKKYSDLSALKGKKIGCEVASLGIYVLQRALAKYGMTIDDVEVVNVEQSRGNQALSDGTIDAYVTYPPTSVDILKSENFKKIFTSADIPNEIIDTVSLSESIVEKNPRIVNKLRKAWQRSLDFYHSNMDEATTIMAGRQGITNEEFSEILADLKVLTYEDQKNLFTNSDDLHAMLKDTCDTLVKIDALQTDCSVFPNMIYSGK